MRLTLEENAERINLHLRGYTDYEIAKRLNKKSTAINRWRERRGLKRNSKNEIAIRRNLK